MQIVDFINKPVVTVEMDDSLRVIKDIFDHTRFHHLLVIDANKLVGIISDRDLLKALSPNIGTAVETTKDTATLNKKAHQIMTRNPVSITSNANIYEVITIFNTHNISCIPIIDHEHTPIGLISWRDIFKAISAKHDAST